VGTSTSALGEDERLDLERRQDGAGGKRVGDGRRHAKAAKGLLRHVVRLLLRFETRLARTPEGGTRSSSHGRLAADLVLEA
jgi:hypothetical protein